MLLDKGAFNFEAIGSTLATFGAGSLSSMDPQDVFCGTYRYFIRLFRLRGPSPLTNLLNLAGLSAEVAPELRR
jgi:hypothetical protein